MLAVLRAVYHFPWMLNTHTRCKRLRHKFNASIQQQFICVPAALPCCQYKRAAFYAFFAVRRLHYCRGYVVVFALYAAQFCFKAHFAAKCSNLLPHVSNSLYKPIRAYMRLRHHSYLLRRTEAMQQLYNLMRTRVLYARCQLAVRKRARSAFAEHYVAFRVQLARPPERFDVPSPVVHTLAALKHYRLIAVFRQRICCKKSCRAKPYHYYRLIERLCTEYGFTQFKRLRKRKPFLRKAYFILRA